MCLPLHDEVELKRWVVFLVSRWVLDHHWHSVMIQALFMDMPVTKAEYMYVIRCYMDCRRNERPKKDW
jgi:hypothetical protein